MADDDADDEIISWVRIVHNCGNIHYIAQFDAVEQHTYPPICADCDLEVNNDSITVDIVACTISEIITMTELFRRVREYYGFTRRQETESFEEVLTRSITEYTPPDKPATEAQLAKLKHVLTENIPADTNCCICQETLVDTNSGDKTSVIKPEACDHCFHSSCLLEWLKRNDNCPQCRTSI